MNPAAAPDEITRLSRQVADLQTALEHRERQIEAIRRTSDALLSQRSSVDAMVRETLELTLNVLGAAGGTVYLHDPATDTLVFRCVLGPMAEALTGQRMPTSKGIAGKVFQSGQPDLTQSTMTAPMMRSGGSVIGVMQIVNAQPTPDAPSRPFDERDLEVLQVLCGQVAAAIEQAPRT